MLSFKVASAAPCPSPPVPGDRLPADSLQHARILGAARPRCAPVHRVRDAGPTLGLRDRHREMDAVW